MNIWGGNIILLGSNHENIFINMVIDEENESKEFLSTNETNCQEGIAVSCLPEHCSIFRFPSVPPPPSVTGVTSQLSSIIWWFTMKTIYFLNAYHLCWWYSQVKPNRAQYSPVQPSKAQYSSLQSNTEQNRTEHFSAAQLQSSCSLVKPSRAQYSPV